MTKTTWEMQVLEQESGWRNDNTNRWKLWYPKTPVFNMQFNWAGNVDAVDSLAYDTHVCVAQTQFVKLVRQSMLGPDGLPLFLAAFCSEEGESHRCGSAVWWRLCTDQRMAKILGFRKGFCLFLWCVFNRLNPHLTQF